MATEGRVQVTRAGGGGGEGRGSLSFLGYRVSVWDAERFWTRMVVMAA